MRALLAEEYKREIIFPVNFITSPCVNERNTLVLNARKRGYKTHSFTPKRIRLAM
jgi:hypothetical protein